MAVIFRNDDDKLKLNPTSIYTNRSSSTLCESRVRRFSVPQAMIMAHVWYLVLIAIGNDLL
jgi:hypothetical protein